MTTVLGAKQLNQKLARLPSAAVDEMRLSLAVSAREMADMMEQLVPKATGRLAGSIGWTFGEPPKGSFVGGRFKTKEGIVATVYAGDEDAFYARFVEFGTIKTPAQPFFFVAYRALRKRAISRIKRGQSKAAKKVAAS